MERTIPIFVNGQRISADPSLPCRQRKFTSSQAAKMAMLERGRASVLLKRMARGEETPLSPAYRAALKTSTHES